MPFEIFILGCSSATPTIDRHPTAQVLNIRNSSMLIDCGEATQNQLLQYRIRHSRIKYIFISHLHGDHYLGLNGLLATINFQGRDEELHIYGPEPLEMLIMDHFKHSGTTIRFPLFFHKTTDQQQELILSTDNFEVHSIPLQHRIPTTGFLFKERGLLKKINAPACEKAKVPYTYYDNLKEGKDYQDPKGKIIPNAELTFPADKPRCYAYMSDTLYNPAYAEVIKNVNLLYHESTFMHELVDRAHETMHTTALEAGMLAKQANAGKLLLGHFSARYRDLTPLLFEAQTVFENTGLAIEGEKFVVD